MKKVAVFFVLPLALPLFSCARTRHPRNVILISIDTLRADHLGCYGYGPGRTPNIDALAAEGALFENAATAVPLTLPAHSSIFTGRTPLRHGMVDNFGFRLPASETTLAEKLKAQGLATGGFVGAFVLDARFGIDQGFDTYFDHFDAPSESATALGSHERPADEVLRPALEWIAGRGDQSFFAFVHFFDPHAPYDPPSRFLVGSGVDDVARYDAEIAFVDSQVGELVAFVKERGIYEESLIVLLGDHGESLGEHGEATHGLFVYDATIRVPLIVRGPGVAPGTRLSAQVRTIDVMPTVLELLGFEPGSEVEGVSLASLLEGSERDLDLKAYFESHYSRIHYGFAPLRGLRTERFKFIEAPTRELYDLSSDPGETRNLAPEEPQPVEALAKKLARLRASGGSPRLETAGRDSETERKLRSLGYITSTSASSAAEETLPDPKDKIGIFGRMTEARNRSEAGDIEGARALLHEVLEEDPGVMLAYLMLGNIHLQRKEYLEAEEVFRRALAREDESVEASYGLARAHQGSGRLVEAETGFRRVLELDPDRVQAVFLLAEVNLALGRAEEAERLVRERLSRGPDSSLRLVLADALLRQKKRDAAWAVLREAQRDDEQNATVHLNIGNMLLEENRLDEALAAYRRASELDPKSAEIVNGLGNAFARRGEDALALGAFQKAAELDPGYSPARNNLGIALARSGRLDEAERAFGSAIESDPDYAEAYNNLGFLHLQQGAINKSIPLLRRALALKPDYAQARLNLEEALRLAKITER
ncbi:MAG TPA: sulfatase-like hydrolase/transferase [Vicinamibacteria bacterium]|nr:sulfatase-like hydrolase/transferase [Vicinamibacteria bacterium]